MRVYLTWARSIFSPRDRFLPGLGARLDRYPRLVTLILMALRRLPTGRARAAGFRNIAKPLLRRTQMQLEVPVSSGCRMVVDTGDLIGSELAISGTWEPHVTAAFRELLSREDVCVDVGANIGYFTLLASQLVGPSGRVYAFEPLPSVYAMLRSNLELNSVTNVTALCVAAGDTDGRAHLYVAPSGHSSIRPLDARSTLMTVRTCRLDSIVPTSDLARIKLVKIDVEGYEPEVVRGLEGVFEAGGRPAVILEVTPARNSNEAAAELSSFCARHRLKTYGFVDVGLLSGRTDGALTLLEPRLISMRRHERLLLPEELRAPGSVFSAPQ